MSRDETTIIGIKLIILRAFGLLKQTAQEFLQDKAPQLGAALAYYTFFSLAPLILVFARDCGGPFPGRSIGCLGSAYGPASSLITLLLWIYYSSQILLFGAEFTQVCANRAGREVEPDEYAVRVQTKEVETR